MNAEWQAAVEQGDGHRLQELLSAGQDVNARDRYGQTALMRCAHAGHQQAVSVLVAGGADLEHRAKYNLTALLLAVLAGHADIVRILVQAGADTSAAGSGAPGFDRKTALDLAVEQGRKDIADLLRGTRSRPAS